MVLDKVFAFCMNETCHCKLIIIFLCTLDVKLKDSGAEQLEVSDNGKGVEEANFEGLSKRQLCIFGEMMIF